MMLQMGLVALAGDSPWGPPRMIAAIVMGEGVLPPPATFDLMMPGLSVPALQCSMPARIVARLGTRQPAPDQAHRTIAGSMLKWRLSFSRVTREASWIPGITCRSHSR
jgi:hypothetical protein